MKRLLVPTLLLALGGASPALAQPYADPGNPAALVRNWYHRFMNRDPDPQGMSDWVDGLRRGMSPEWALANFLTSPEYFQRTGNTTEQWIAQLLTDLTGHQPTQRQYDYWLYRARTDSARDVAYELVTRYWQPFGGSPYYGNPYGPRQGGGGYYDPYGAIGRPYDPYNYGATRYRRGRDARYYGW